MSKFSQSSTFHAPPAAEQAEDDARAGLERDLRSLAELIQIGMTTVRILRRQIEAGDRDAMAGFPSIADEVIRTIALHRTLRKRLADMGDKPAPARPPRAIAADETKRARQRKDQVKDLVEAAIKDGAGGRRTVERRLLQLDEWLENPALEVDLAKRTSGQVAADMCRLLGITPDISGWPAEALWEEAIRDFALRGRH